MWNARSSRAEWPLVGWLLLVLALGACEEQPGPTLSPLPRDGVILAFGNSLTHGTGARWDQSYPAQLESLIGRRVLASGRPGELSAAGLKRLAGVLEQTRPDLLILCHGGNDILRRKDDGATAENLRAMIRLAQAKGIQVVLIGVPEPGLLGLESAEFYGQVARELGIPYEDAALAAILSDDALTSDPIHPNGAGYRALAEALADLLRRAGALSEGNS